MNKRKRILGIDYGDVRTGIAVSDENQFLASGITTLKATGDSKLIEQILPYIEQYDIEMIVLGDPINMNGSRGIRSEKVHLFAQRLQLRCDIPIAFMDERTTTIVAHTIMNETNTKGKKRKNSVDTLSAEIILQNYLDAQKR